MNKLTVFKSQTGWNIRFDEGKERDSVMTLFGTDTLPLPFTVQASAETVALDVESRYPGADITLDLIGLHHGLPQKAGKLSWTEVPGEVA